MSKNKVVELVDDIAVPIIAKHGMELVDVEYTREGNQWYLRIFMDKPGGITVEDCQAISNELSLLLDEKDFIPHAYILEVSSPGLDRPLKKDSDYERFQGRKIDLTTYALLNGRKKFSGRLEGLRDRGVVLMVNGMELVIPMEQVASARLAVEI